MNIQNIILASHGTRGAQAAEQTLFSILNRGMSVMHLIVVPDFWEGMMGDDWLNNASTRDVYKDYVEGELEKEVRETIQRVKLFVEQQEASYDTRLVRGEPDKCLLSLIEEVDVDTLILGGRRPKGVEGLRSYMLTERLMKGLTKQLLVTPYPA